MDPTTTFCPHVACSASGQTGQGNSGLHSCTDKRFLCPECHKTFSATKGPAFYRLRPSAETGSLGGTLLAHGCPLHASVVAFGYDERTGAGWAARGGAQGQAVQAPLVEPPRALGQGQAEESRGKQPGGMVWLAWAMRVCPRWWLGGAVREPRDRPLLRRRLERVRRWAAPRPLLCWTDGVVSSIRAMRETCRAPGPTGTGGRPRLRPWRQVLIAPGVQRDERRRVVETTRRMVDGTPLFLYVLAIQVLGLAFAARADEASDAAVYRVSYIEVMPLSQDETMALLRQYREASRREEGNVRLEVLQQNGRPDHFVLLETWKDQKALDAHDMATHTAQLRDKLQPLRVSPFDERLHKGLAIGSALAARTAGATYVVTHADAVPSGKDEALILLKQLAETSRNDDGNVHFEVLQQSSRQNHCTIIEVWKDQKALAAHVMAGHTRQFREKFQPLSGSLYDERLYTALD